MNISSVINDEYENFVTVLDYHNQVNVQNRCYENVYEDIKTLYDWICIFDCDEFLYLDTFNNISEADKTVEDKYILTKLRSLFQAIMLYGMLESL